MNEELKTSPIEDFDWDAYENGDAQTGKTREELTKTYDESLNTVKDKDVIEGTIIALNKREAVVNIGYKSDGIIPMSEFRYNPDIKIGDTVEVFIENQEDKKGQLILSHRKARMSRSWDRINQALENDEIIKGLIKCRTKGGMIVDVFGIEAFLPGSQIDVKPIRDYDIFVGKTMEFKVVKINQEFKNVVVSHKALIEAELEAQKREIIAKLERGQILKGVVKNITSYGVFIDLGGVDGLIHISDLSWTKKIKHPSEFTQVGADIDVQVLEIDKDNRRLSLGHKQLEENPWDALESVFTVGSIHNGTIIELQDKGGVVALSHGVEGFATPKHLVKEDGTPAKVNEALDFKVIEFNKDNKRIFLSHSRIFEDEAKAEKNEARKAARRQTKKEEQPAAATAVERTTLGDLEELAALKERLSGKK
ncbi:S1 RNA-binding domain-containing protein [uncultured Muribaculum sp.]|uniref:30S ribosomal protein S1 n=1 Tax=uncultured Muribaculum sp. TaxID=1918613 RepID=UPI0025B2592E|nr:S1 RNA-binding domain-containing protein [uncultured Muribaculum sp.]